MLSHRFFPSLLFFFYSSFFFLSTPSKSGLLPRTSNENNEKRERKERKEENREQRQRKENRDREKRTEQRTENREGKQNRKRKGKGEDFSHEMAVQVCTNCLKLANKRRVRSPSLLTSLSSFFLFFTFAELPHQPRLFGAPLLPLFSPLSSFPLLSSLFSLPFFSISERELGLECFFFVFFSLGFQTVSLPYLFSFLLINRCLALFDKRNLRHTIKHSRVQRQKTSNTEFNHNTAPKALMI